MNRKAQAIGERLVEAAIALVCWGCLALMALGVVVSFVERWQESNDSGGADAPVVQPTVQPLNSIPRTPSTTVAWPPPTTVPMTVPGRPLVLVAQTLTEAQKWRQLAQWQQQGYSCEGCETYEQWAAYRTLNPTVQIIERASGSSYAQELTQQSTHGRTGAVCRDGWVSSSTGRGTCSHHGGVARWLP